MMNTDDNTDELTFHDLTKEEQYAILRHRGEYIKPTLGERIGDVFDACLNVCAYTYVAVVVLVFGFIAVCAVGAIIESVV